MDGLYELMVYSLVLVGLSVLLGWGLHERFQHRKSQVIIYTSPVAPDSVTPVNEDSVAMWHVLYQAKR